MVERPLISGDAERIGPPSERALEFLPADISPSATMRAVAPTVCAVFGVDPPAGADEAAIDDVVETLTGSERLAHIVIDAFGVNIWNAHQNVAHAFNAIAAQRQLEIQSVLPAITPVNFSTIASGASPEQHGVRNRAEELKLDTTFARLAAAGKTTTAAGRALSTVGILLAPHSSNPALAESNTDREVADLFRERAAEQIDYILAQVLDVDEAGHLDGPWGVKMHQAVGRTDRRLRNMLDAAAEHGYAVIVHADHGCHEIGPDEDPPKPEEKGAHSGLYQEDVRVPFVYLTNAELRGALSPE